MHPPPRFFISVASKRLRVLANSLESTLANGGIRIDSKELKIALELCKLGGCWRFKLKGDSASKAQPVSLKRKSGSRGCRFLEFFLSKRISSDEGLFKRQIGCKTRIHPGCGSARPIWTS